MPDDTFGHLLMMDVARASAPNGAHVTFLEGNHRRWVKAGGTYGLADAYTSTHVQVLFRSGPGLYALEWIPAGIVHSVPKKDWRGLPLED